MKKVEVRLYANLVKYRPNQAGNEALIIELEDKADLEDLLNKLRIPKKEVTISMVNGRSEEEGYTLQDGDRVGFFSAIAGG